MPEQFTQRRAYRLVDLRDGDRCVMCDEPVNIREHSHRAHAGHGGHKASIRPSNLLVSCGPFGCNFKLSHNAAFAELGRRNGWLISRYDDPTTVPVLYHGGWVLLDDAGGYTAAEPPSEGTPQPMNDDTSATAEPTAEDDPEQQPQQQDGLVVAFTFLSTIDTQRLLTNRNMDRDRIAFAHALATATLAAATRAQVELAQKSYDLQLQQHQLLMAAAGGHNGGLLVPGRG